MLAHLPANSLMASSPTLAWIGALVLIIGETAALMSLPNLVRVFVISTVAELGYVLIGFGVGGPAGDTGALMHLGFQMVMRGLVLAAGWSLVRRTGSAKLDDLAGSGRRMPLTATLFGFGVFSVMGLSPFKGSFSKFIILYAAIERGLWPVALAGTLATIVAAVYYMLVVQRVCLEPKARDGRACARPAARHWPLAWPLAALTVVLSLWPAPFLRIRRAPRRLPGRAKACRNSTRLGPRRCSSPMSAPSFSTESGGSPSRRATPRRRCWRSPPSRSWLSTEASTRPRDCSGSCSPESRR